MHVVLDADGRVIAAGDTDSLVAPEGGQVIQTDTDPLAGLTEGEEAVWDAVTSSFFVRQRVLSLEEQAHKSAKTLVLNAAQSAVGVRFDQLTNVQVRALVAIVLWQVGALGGDGTVQPLGDWVRG